MTDGLVIRGAVAAIGGRRLYGPLDLVIPPGDILTVTGPSGTGKSTLLAQIAGTLAPGITTMGRISLMGRSLDRVPPERRRIGVVFQDALLFPHLSVAGNLGFGLAAGVRGEARRARIAAALEAAGLAGFGDKDPATLSGGERARIALMRTLLAAPEAILLDEPFSKLDTALRAQIRAFTFAEIRRLGLPCLLVTHDEADADAAGGPRHELAA